MKMTKTAVMWLILLFASAIGVSGCIYPAEEESEPYYNQYTPDEFYYGYPYVPEYRQPGGEHEEHEEHEQIERREQFEHRGNYEDSGHHEEREHREGDEGR